MSFDLYVQCFKNGEPAGFPREAIRHAFGAHLAEPEQDHWQLVFGPGESCQISLSPLDQSSELVHNITIERPCSDIRLWQGLAQLLSEPRTVLYFPGCSGPLLVHLDAAAHLPQGMLEALGQPKAIACGADIHLFAVAA